MECIVDSGLRGLLLDAVFRALENRTSLKHFVRVWGFLGVIYAPPTFAEV